MNVCDQCYKVQAVICTALVVLAITLNCGCAGHLPRTFTVEPFTLIVADRADIQAAWEAYPNHRRVQVRGFYDELTRTVWVERGYAGRPNLSALGHELWHLEELGGRWHK